MLAYPYFTAGVVIQSSTAVLLSHSCGLIPQKLLVFSCPLCEPPDILAMNFLFWLHYLDSIVYNQKFFLTSCRFDPIIHRCLAICPWEGHDKYFKVENTSSGLMVASVSVLSVSAFLLSKAGFHIGRRWWWPRGPELACLIYGLQKWLFSNKYWTVKNKKSFIYGRHEIPLNARSKIF